METGSQTCNAFRMIYAAKAAMTNGPYCCRCCCSLLIPPGEDLATRVERLENHVEPDHLLLPRCPLALFAIQFDHPYGTNTQLLQDFFSTAIGNVKKVSLAYGPSGKSRGEATVLFGKPDAAARAHKEYNNVGVDGKPMRVSKSGPPQTRQLLICRRSSSWLLPLPHRPPSRHCRSALRKYARRQVCFLPC